MSVRRMMERHTHARLCATLCVIVIAATGCRWIGNVEEIRYGREFSPDGERLRLASLQPRCGCVSVANTSPERVWVESWFRAIPRGAVIFEPGDRRRLLFDWAGPENSDFYELVAFRVANRDGVDARDDGPGGGFLFQDVLAEYTELALVDCDDQTCDFGPLAMNRVIQTAQSPSQTSLRQQGVDVGSTIELAAPISRCGCMMARNISADNTLTLRATLHGNARGQLTLPPSATVAIPFDWAGPLESDQYVIDAVSIEGRQTLGQVLSGPIVQGLQGPVEQADQPPVGASRLGGVAQPTGMSGQGGMSIRISDYVIVVGEMLDMNCTPEYAEFDPRAAGAPALPAAARVANLIQCPWMPGGQPQLGMFAAYDPGRTLVVPPRGAVNLPAPGSAVPDSVPAPAQ